MASPSGTPTPVVDDGKTPHVKPVEGQQPNLEAGGDAGGAPLEASDRFRAEIQTNAADGIRSTDKSAMHASQKTVDGAVGMEWTDKSNKTFFRTPESTYAVTKDANGRTIYTPDNPNARPIGRRTETDASPIGALDASGGKPRSTVTRTEIPADQPLKDRKAPVDRNAATETERLTGAERVAARKAAELPTALPIETPVVRGIPKVGDTSPANPVLEANPRHPVKAVEANPALDANPRNPVRGVEANPVVDVTRAPLKATEGIVADQAAALANARELRGKSRGGDTDGGDNLPRTVLPRDGVPKDGPREIIPRDVVPRDVVPKLTTAEGLAQQVQQQRIAALDAASSKLVVPTAPVEITSAGQIPRDNRPGSKLELPVTTAELPGLTGRPVKADLLNVLPGKADKVETPTVLTGKAEIRQEIKDFRQEIKDARQDPRALDSSRPGVENFRSEMKRADADYRAMTEKMNAVPKDIALPQNMADKLNAINSRQAQDMLLSFQQVRDREGKAGEMGVRRGLEGDQALRALDALKGGPNAQKIPGFDLNDKANREFLADAMKRLDAGKGQKVEDIFRGMDQDKALRLGKFLTEGSLDGRANPARMKDFMALGEMPKTPTERLYDFMKVGKDLVNNQQLSPRDTQRALGDLTKILGDVNKQLGVDGKAGLTVQDILGRKLDPSRPGERLAALELNGAMRSMTNSTESMTMTAKMTASQETGIRQMLEQRNQRDQGAVLVGRNADGQQAGSRFEAPQSRIEAAQANAARVDAAGRNIDTTAGARPETVVKADARQEMAGRPETVQQRLPEQVVVAGAKGPDVPIDKADNTTQVKRQDELLEEKEKKLKDDREKEKEREKDKEEARQEKMRLDALMLAALADKKRKQVEQEQKDKEKAEEKDKQRDREQRRKYIVREKDTLQSIATAQLRDVRMAPLIYEINKEVIQIRYEEGKPIPDLKPKMVIWLPSTTEIDAFRKSGVSGIRPGISAQGGDKKMSAEDELAARFGTSWAGGKPPGPGAVTGNPVPPSVPSAQVTAALAASAMESAQKRRANIENLLGPIGRQQPADGRIKYIARLGDSLKSVSMKHPALQDVNLWKLLAEVNDMSTAVDAKGAPVATISRGAVLMMPSLADIEEYKTRKGMTPQSVPTSVDTRPAGVTTEVATKFCDGCKRMTVASATICPACGNEFDLSDEERMEHSRKEKFSESQQVDDDADAKTVFISPPQAPIFTDDEIEKTTIVTPSDVQQFVEMLHEACRLVRSDNSAIVSQLEVCRAGNWEPVVSYEIYDDVSLRHEHTLDGKKRTVRIDLPPAAARELANNDLHSNWQQYCGSFLGQPAEQ